MPNYRENQTAAVSWRRACSAVIHNPLPGRGVPRIVFDEQDVVSAGGEVIAATQVFVSPEDVSVAFQPGVEIELIDPESGEPTGQTMTHEQLRTALHSLYMSAAKARDARAEAQQAIQQQQGAEAQPQ